MKVLAYLQCLAALPGDNRFASVGEQDGAHGSIHLTLPFFFFSLSLLVLCYLTSENYHANIDCQGAGCHLCRTSLFSVWAKI
jgi:hypothetical protein